MITLDAIWKLKPIRFLIRGQLHDTVAGEIRMGNFRESIQLCGGSEDTKDIGLLLIPRSLRIIEIALVLFRARRDA